MMNILTKKRGKKGFTLMELLIVVAIIAILVAISIPVFSSQLEKAREATDVANMRAAKACAVTRYLTNDPDLGFDSAKTSVDLYYDAAKGTLESAKTNITAYGKGTATDGKVDTTTYQDATGGTSTAKSNATVDHTNQILKVTIVSDGTVTVVWEAK